MTDSTLPGLPKINLPPPTPAQLGANPLRDAMQEIGPAVMRWFLDVHGREIIVWADIAERPDNKREVVFKFRMHKSGLMPTDREKRTFNAFIAGYRSAINIALSLAEPESSTLRN